MKKRGYPIVIRLSAAWDEDTFTWYIFKGYESLENKLAEIRRHLLYCVADGIGFLDTYEDRVYFYSRKKYVLEDTWADGWKDTHNMLFSLPFWKANKPGFIEYVAVKDILRYLKDNQYKHIHIDEMDIDSLGEDAKRLKMEFDEMREEEFVAWQIERREEEW